MINYKLLKKIRDQILKEPRRFFMENWLDNESPVAPCGTAACIGGHAVIMSEGKQWRATALKMANRMGSYDLSDYINYRATKLLRLSKDQSNQLFGLGYWPERFSSAYMIATSPKDKARIAADRINFFIQTKGTDKEITKRKK